MKKLAMAVVLGWAGIAAAAGSTTSVVNSPHDLSPTGLNVAINSAANAQAQVCVFCHFPHNANNAGSPLWNRRNATVSFQMYSQANSSTFQLANGDTNTAARPVGAVSLACLSCHDGQTAFNSLNQSPMIDLDPGLSSQGSNYTFTLVGGAALPAGATMSNVAATNTEGSANLGTDLTNDHPISFTYNAALVTLKGSTLRDPTVTAPITGGADDLVIYRAGAVAAGGPNTIAGQMLFTKPGAGLPDQLECASCHEPHRHGDETNAHDNFPFLIKSNYGSELCLTCHAK
jgi:hypothetical protein